MNGPTRIILILIAVAIAACPAGAAVDERTVSIPMRDGVQLEALVITPVPPQPAPTILVRTPYGKQQHLDEARFWGTNGYAVVIQDARGKFGSEGVYTPFLNEYADGTDTIDWIVSQAWSNGSVGMWGSSYLAFCQLVMASSRHPALKSIVPISGWIQDDGQIEHGGAHHIMLSIPWIYHEESQTRRSLANVDLDDLFEFLPLMDTFEAIGVESRIWTEQFDFCPLDDFSASDIAIPALHITGWNDFVCGAALGVYRETLRGPAADEQRLIVGPWIHDQFWTTYSEVGDEDFGPQSVMGRERLMQLTLDWFNDTLGPDADGVGEWPPARVFVMGANEWREFDQWPPRAETVAMYIGSEEGANSLHGDGMLSMDAAASGRDRYRFDPMNPVPTYGGANFHFFPHLLGVKDQREIEARDDVLVYTSAPFAQETLVAGPLEAVLYVSTQGRDTDFTAKLVEVRGDGYARIIEEGIIRLSHRDGGDAGEQVEPGTVYEVRIDMGATAIAIAAGHRLRLEVSSSNFPKYDRNPNTGEEALLASKLVPVDQTVYFGPERPSRVVLPVLGSVELAAEPEAVDTAGEATSQSAAGEADDLLRRGRALLDDGALEEAIDVLEQAVAAGEDRTDCHTWLGRAYIAKLQTVSFFQKGPLASRALEHLRRAVALDPANIGARESLIGYYLNAPGIAGGSKKKAAEQAAEVAKYDAVRGSALLARVYMAREDYDGAAEALESCIEADPDNVDQRYQLGMLHQKTEAWDDAFDAFEAALAIDPNAPAALYQLARTAVFSGRRVERGIECLERYLTLEVPPGYPGADAAHWRLGMLFERAGDAARAEAEYRSALELKPDDEKYRKSLNEVAGR